MTESTRDRLAQIIGTHYDGHADPVETPVNWRRAVGAVDAILSELGKPSEGVADAMAEAWGVCFAAGTERIPKSWSPAEFVAAMRVAMIAAIREGK